MRRTPVLLSFLLLGLPVPLWAGDAQPQAAEVPLTCGAPGKVDASAFEPVAARALTDEERRDLRKLFGSVDGQWHGRLTEEICMPRGARHKEYTSTLRARKIGDELELRGEDVLLEGRARKPYQRRFYINPEGLWVDVPSKRGEVEPLQISDSGLSFLRRYRVVRTIDGTQQKRTVSVAHEERYSLQLTGSHTLTVTQHFLTQGVYSGSMTWQLSRD